mmetsp:Transcript_87523/g.137036  ORF Transcript_87523/g.137036 Transcript_87523/m.137036 type:complete len:921 (+) Transcript_87523:43-2805(+)
MSRSDNRDLPRRPNLGEVLRLGPTFSNAQRLTKGSSLQKASSASQLLSQQQFGEVVLEPLSPPRAVSSCLEEKRQPEEDDNQKLWEERLRLMEKSRPTSAPSGNTPSSPSRHKVKVSRFARETRCRVRRQDLHQNYSGLWGDLNPFDPIQNPEAHRLLLHRSVSPPRKSRSSSRDQDLESFRPSFRTEWLIALRHELLKGTREENKKLRKDFDAAIAAAVAEVHAGYEAAVMAIRKDYADAVGDIRHDFIDAFVEGDISHMIEAARGKRREVDVDFSPVFAEMEQFKSSVFEVMRNHHEALSSTISAETNKSVVDLSRSVGEDFVKVLDHIGAASSSALEEIRSQKVDLSPVFAAIEAVDRDVDLGPLSDSVKDIEAKLHSSARQILDAISAAPHWSILQQIDELRDEMRARSEQDHLITLSAIAGVGIDIGEQLKDASDVSISFMSKLDLDSVVSKLESSIKRNATQIEEAVKKNTKSPDFSSVLDAIAKLDLGTLSRQIDSRYADTCKFLDSSILKPLQKAVNDHDVDLKPIFELIGKVIKQQDNIASSQKIVNQAVVDTKDCAMEARRIAASPDFTPVLRAIGRLEDQVRSESPPTDLSPVLEAIKKVNVRPEVHVNLQEILDALGKVGPEVCRALAASTNELSEKSQADIERLCLATEQICSEITSHSNAISQAVADVKRCNEVEHESVINALSRDAEQKSEAFDQMNAKRQADLQQVLHAIAGIEEVDLMPLQQEMNMIATSAASFHSATLNAIQGIHVDPVDFAPIFQEMETHKAALSHTIHRIDLETKAELKALLERVNNVDMNTSIDLLGPLQKSIDEIDVTPVVDLQPILEAVDKIELAPVIQVDTKPIMQLITTGLAKIEFAWAKVDNTEVLEAVQAIHKRILEAIVKIDAKDPSRSPNFIWASEAAKWT